MQRTLSDNWFHPCACHAYVHLFQWKTIPNLSSEKTGKLERKDLLNMTDFLSIPVWYISCAYEYVTTKKCGWPSDLSAVSAQDASLSQIDAQRRCFGAETDGVAGSGRPMFVFVCLWRWTRYVFGLRIDDYKNKKGFVC